jgi:dTDP-glucose pyrophosphorylase
MVSINHAWRKAILPVDATIDQAIRNLNESGIKIILVVTNENFLEGTISDGDIRRGLLKGLQLNSPVASIIHRNPLVAPSEMDQALVAQLMVANKIQQIPVVDESGHIVGLHLWADINAPSIRPNIMVIMAGGLGSRLHPYTENCPKPLLTIAGKPMLEHIIERAKLDGFQQFVLSIHHLGHMIEEYFGDGESLNVKIRYLRETSPLGTAGALSLLTSLPNAPFVVTNGDVMTDVKYGQVIDFHLRHEAEATMAVRSYEWQHPFGVVQTQGVEIVGFEEKPINRTHINAGIYVLDPAALNTLKAGEYCDMPVLFERLRSDSRRTVAYPMHEPWLDVGRPSDLQLANNGHKLNRHN